ncbi:LLM class flavin-dependent oxidoreductase [Actinocrispum sp. NPDC049592]|uniref:LLM class flavin-dependent oxidoreductase n=1 Tax=Actinocrispum sp. NPDC049592 TaxID=3154835 RepID=UPI00343F0C3D
MTKKSLRHGVYLPPFGPFGDPAVLVDLAVRAEAAGWDGVFLWDHLVTDAMPIVDPWTTLGAIAQATERIRLGTMVTPLARRRPWVVARHAGTLSRLSGGRFVLGTGLGSDESGDFSRFGEPDDARTRASMYDEGLDVVRAMWSGEATEHDGGHYRLRLAATAPEPHPIPVWVGCSTTKPRVLRRAAAGDGIFPNPSDHRVTPAELTGILAAVHETGLVGDRPFDVAVAGNASHAWEEPIEVDVKGLHQAGMTWWMESLIHFDPLDLSLKIVDAGPPQIP